MRARGDRSSVPFGFGVNADGTTTPPAPSTPATKALFVANQGTNIGDPSVELILKFTGEGTSGVTKAVAADLTYFYWGTNSGLRRRRRDLSDAATTIDATLTAIYNLIWDPTTNRLYYTLVNVKSLFYYDIAAQRRVGPITALAWQGDCICSDGKNIYICDGTGVGGPPPSSLRRCKMDGSNLVTLSNNTLHGPAQMTTDGIDIYWTDGTAIGKWNIAGGTLNTGWATAIVTGAGGLAVDSTFVYVADFTNNIIKTVLKTNPATTASYATTGGQPMQMCWLP